MLTIDRQSCIEAATPEEVFAILSSPENMLQLLPRLRKAELETFTDGTTNLALCLAIGGMFGTICFDGNLTWIEPAEIVLYAYRSLQGEIRWILEPTVQGTNLRVLAQLDIAPLLGPLMFVVSTAHVERKIGNELEQSLHSLAEQFAQQTHARHDQQEPQETLEPTDA